jgi:hypothetical protein
MVPEALAGERGPSAATTAVSAGEKVLRMLSKWTVTFSNLSEVWRMPLVLALEGTVPDGPCLRKRAKLFLLQMLAGMETG